nr:unnamed protein product [Callosobruchus analis]
MVIRPNPQFQRPSQPNTNFQRTIRPNPNYNPQHHFGHAQTSETQLCDSDESSEWGYFDASCYSQASCEQICDPNYWEPNLDFRNDISHDEPPPLTLFEDMSEMEMDEPKKPLSMSEEIDQQLLRWIVKGYHSFRVVEEPEFQKLVETMCPSYKVPCRKTVSASLRIRYCVRKLFYCHNCALAEAGQELKLCSYLLDCFAYEERHTAQNLASILQEKIVEWKIENKIVCCK